jgi:hypothetical protein
MEYLLITFQMGIKNFIKLLPAFSTKIDPSIKH